MEPLGPCDAISPATGEPVRALRVDEIVQIQESLVASARRLWRAGYDAVELLAANGYLFQTFFSSRFNHRDDQYGGTLANRMRFLSETVARIQEALSDLRLLVRLSMSKVAMMKTRSWPLPLPWSGRVLSRSISPVARTKRRYFRGIASSRLPCRGGCSSHLPGWL